jgi:16S rRNA (cytosine967-C5)-methyltransferase
VHLARLLSSPTLDDLDARERAFLHGLVLGTVRWRGRLDHAIGACSERPLEEIDPVVRDSLRLGAYQLLEMRVPARAAVHETVELVRLHHPAAAGFVNAVLRRLAREGPPPLPDFRREPLAWLTSAGSLPAWLARRWHDRLGPQAARARAEALLRRPVLCCRLNPRQPAAAERLAEAGARLAPSAVPGTWRAEGDLPRDLVGAGLAYAQDAGSQLVARLAATTGLTWDACAAPGGKAALLGDLAPPGSRVVASDRRPARAGTMATLLGRWGLENVRVAVADATQPPWRTRFDCVLLDAPCSGLGTLRANPDIRWRLRPGQLAAHQARQRALLDAVAGYVRPGGRLVYAACSTEPEENEEVIAPFLDHHREFTMVAPPAWAAAWSEASSCVRTLPERDDMDGFFAALLERR